MSLGGLDRLGKGLWEVKAYNILPITLWNVFGTPLILKRSPSNVVFFSPLVLGMEVSVEWAMIQATMEEDLRNLKKSIISRLCSFLYVN